MYTYSQRGWGSIHVQELVEPGTMHTAIYIKSGLSGKAEHAETPTSGCAPGGGRSAGSRWVGASTHGERQRGRSLSHSSAEEHSGPLRGSVQGIERRSPRVAVSGCMQGHAVQTRCKYLCGDVPTPRRSEGYTPKCSDFSDHPRLRHFTSSYPCQNQNSVARGGFASLVGNLVILDKSLFAWESDLFN